MLAGFLTKKLTLNKSEVKCLIQGLTSLLLSPGGAEGTRSRLDFQKPNDTLVFVTWTCVFLEYIILKLSSDSSEIVLLTTI